MALQPPNYPPPRSASSLDHSHSSGSSISGGHSIYGTIPRKPLPEKRSHNDIYGTISRKPLPDKHAHSAEQIYGTIPRKRVTDRERERERDRDRDRDRERERERRDRDRDRERDRDRDRDRERDRDRSHARDVYGTIPRRPKVDLSSSASRSADIYGTISRKPRLSVETKGIQSPQEKLADLLNRDLLLDHNYGSSSDRGNNFIL